MLDILHMIYYVYIYIYAYIQAQREGEIERHSVYLYIYLHDRFPVMSFRACKRTWDRPTDPPTIKVCEHRWQAWTCHHYVTMGVSSSFRATQSTSFITIVDHGFITPELRKKKKVPCDQCILDLALFSLFFTSLWLGSVEKGFGILGPVGRISHW